VDPIEWTGELSDGVVLIRLLAADDAPAFAQGFQDDPTLGVMVGAETDPTIDEVALQAADATGPNGIPALAIADASTREFLGGIGLYRIDPRHGHAEVGFWLTPAARGRGVAKRAVTLITTWAFDTLGFARVELTTTPDNSATRALALKLGFREEGTMRQRNLERGRRVDVMMFAVLKDEWRGGAGGEG
jgi:ribosomal-protein-alanine N-acetyltransferase